MRTKFKIQSLVLAIVLFACVSLSVSAQTSSYEQLKLSGQGSSSQAGPMEILGKGLKDIPSSIPEEAQFALDVAIDPENYVLGPGDVLGVNLRSGSGWFFQAMITPEGNLLVPSLPMLHVNGKTLSDAIDLIKESWSSSKGANTIDVSIVQMRQMRISIGGIIETPGQKIVSPADRASVVIEMSGGLIPGYSSDRKATLIRSDGEKENVDVLRYLRSGNKEANPLLSSGSHLNVEPYDIDGPKVDIGGGVAFPGSYEWLETDHLMDVIEVAGGFTPDALIDTIVITSFDSDGKPQNHYLNYSELANSRGPEILKGDLIYVRKDSSSPQRATITLQGEVRFPGKYPVVLGETHLSDLIEMAGGFTEHAYLMGARIWRDHEMHDAFEAEKGRLDSLNAQLVSEIEKAYLRYYSRTMKRDYVYVDFEKLFVGNPEERKNQDIIFTEDLVVDIPREIRTVLVAGQVLKPGLYPYKEGEGHKYYIKMAGGYAKNAHRSRIRVIQYESPVWLKASSKVDIEPGSMVFVPEKEVGTDWETFSNAFSLIIQTGTLVMLIIRTL